MQDLRSILEDVINERAMMMYIADTQAIIAGVKPFSQLINTGKAEHDAERSIDAAVDMFEKYGYGDVARETLRGLK